MHARKLVGAVAGLVVIGSLMLTPTVNAAGSGTAQISATNASILELDQPVGFVFGNVAPDGSTINSYENGPIVDGFAYCSGNQPAPGVVANLNWNLTLGAASSFTAAGTGGTDMNLSNFAVLVNPAACSTAPGSGSPALINNWGPNATSSTPQQIATGPSTGPGGWYGQYYDYWLQSLWSNNPGDLTVTLTFTLAAA
ncbi:MAG TPA: hypothetical protein VH482_14365 [Thermomicrobiales bacterium]|jgi:hypothetical protein